MTSPSSLFSVAGKNVLITGGSRGIGLMIAKTFVKHGANVLLTSRHPKACEDAANSLIKQQQQQQLNNIPKVHHIASNVSSREGCKELAQYTNKLFNGKLDVLVNNAGTSWGEDPAYDKDARESGKMNWGWDKVLDLNVKGVFYLIRECTPMLQRRRLEKDGDSNDATSNLSSEPTYDPGRIINIGSVTGFLPQDAPTHAYDVSKAAVHHLTKKIASDLAPYGVTVNCLAPGYVPSRMSASLGVYFKDDMSAEISKNIPLSRMGDEDDMGGACIYFSSRAGAYCTGVILNVDGGMVGCANIPLSSL